MPKAKSVHSNISKENINRRLSIRVKSREGCKKDQKKKLVHHVPEMKTESGEVNRISTYRNSC